MGIYCFFSLQQGFPFRGLFLGFYFFSFFFIFIMIETFITLGCSKCSIHLLLKILSWSCLLYTTHCFIVWKMKIKNKYSVYLNYLTLYHPYSPYPNIPTDKIKIWYVLDRPNISKCNYHLAGQFYCCIICSILILVVKPQSVLFVSSNFGPTVAFCNIWCILPVKQSACILFL